MIKILFFMDTLSEGGAEKVLRTLVNNMDQGQFQITVQTLNEVDPGAYLVPGIRYKAVNRRKTKWGKTLFSYWIRLCAELKWLYPLYIRDDYDIEVAYLECGPTKIMAGSTNKNALKLAWVHCDLKKKPLRDLPKVRRHYGAYDKIVCVSRNVRDSFVRLFGAELETAVVYNANDEAQIQALARAFTPDRTDMPTIAAIGRLAHQKGNDRLLEACRRLKEDGRGFSLWLIGEGPERQALEWMVQAYGLGSQVTFWGFQANPYPYMAAADLIVVPSRYEGFSTVVTEALILGKPVAATPCSGMDELLGDSEFGLITEDSVEGIYQGLKKMLDDPALRAHYAQAAGLRGKAFSKDAVLSRTERFFLSELASKRGKSSF